MTSQRYASLQTKAYIALIAKWYATESFSAALPPAEAPESLNYDIIAKNFDQESHASLQTKAYIALITK